MNPEDTNIDPEQSVPEVCPHTQNIYEMLIRGDAHIANELYKEHADGCSQCSQLRDEWNTFLHEKYAKEHPTGLNWFKERILELLWGAPAMIAIAHMQDKRTGDRSDR
jgi:hypothetical protein